MQSWKRSACDFSTTARHGIISVQKHVCAMSEVGMRVMVCTTQGIWMNILL